MLTNDKKLHIYGGIAIALVLAALLAMVPYIGPGIALAAGSIAFAAGVEVYQKVRNEGEPAVLDAAFSAMPGVLAGLAWLSLE